VRGTFISISLLENIGTMPWDGIRINLAILFGSFLFALSCDSFWFTVYDLFTLLSGKP
jgi:hypothetical protein